MDVSEYTDAQVRTLLPYPKADTNKYARGKLVVVGGSAAYPGAVCLAAFAAQRMGAGYVEVVCAPESVGTVRGYRPSLVVRTWEDCRPGELAVPREGRPCACIIGPGFDARGKVEHALVLSALREVSAPLLVDGGAITALATSEGVQAACGRADDGRPLVLTPHAGEAARLERTVRLDCPDADQVSAERASALAWAYRCVVALKGPDTYLSDGEQVVAMRKGTAALAKAGTGDVLAGMVGALLAQGVGTLDAAVCAASVHAGAGRAAAASRGEIGVTPEDVVDAIPEAIADIEAEDSPRP